MINFKTSLSFPEEFYQFDTKKKKDWTNDISDDEITEWIEECIVKLKKNPGKTSSFIASGNTRVSVEIWDDKYNIVVMKNYWEKEIPLDCEVVK